MNNLNNYIVVFSSKEYMVTNWVLFMQSKHMIVNIPGSLLSHFIVISAPSAFSSKKFQLSFAFIYKKN